jgi:hypothetical protein
MAHETANLAAMQSLAPGDGLKRVNDQLGKHDSVLDFLIEKHEGDPGLVLDTVCDLLCRRGKLSPDYFATGLTEKAMLGIYHRYAAGALDGPVGKTAGGFAAAGAAGAVAAGAVAGAVAVAEPSAAAAGAALVDPGDDNGLVSLPVNISSAVRKELAKSKEVADTARAAQADGGAASIEIPVGTKCKHSACEQTYSSPQSLKQACTFHPGGPVFHEGLKFWSWCADTVRWGSP